MQVLPLVTHAVSRDFTSHDLGGKPLLSLAGVIPFPSCRADGLERALTFAIESMLGKFLSLSCLAAALGLAPSALSQEVEQLTPPVDPATLSAPPSSYTPLSLTQRYRWAARSSVGASRAAGYAISSALATLNNDPEEYGPHWQGYGKRMGMRFASGATGTMLEASIGALWNEDPRYQRAVGQPIRKRLARVAIMTFLARDSRGRLMPAYARYVSVPANSFLSNSWRPDSEARSREAALRIPMSFLNRAIGNAFAEFWPDATKWLHRE